MSARSSAGGPVANLVARQHVEEEALHCLRKEFLILLPLLHGVAMSTSVGTDSGGDWIKKGVLGLVGTAYGVLTAVVYLGLVPFPLRSFQNWPAVSNLLVEGFALLVMMFHTGSIISITVIPALIESMLANLATPVVVGQMLICRWRLIVASVAFNVACTVAVMLWISIEDYQFQEFVHTLAGTGIALTIAIPLRLRLFFIHRRLSHCAVLRVAGGTASLHTVVGASTGVAPAAGGTDAIRENSVDVVPDFPVGNVTTDAESCDTLVCPSDLNIIPSMSSGTESELADDARVVCGIVPTTVIGATARASWAQAVGERWSGETMRILPGAAGSTSSSLTAVQGCVPVAGRMLDFVDPAPRCSECEASCSSTCACLHQSIECSTLSSGEINDYSMGHMRSPAVTGDHTPAPTTQGEWLPPLPWQAAASSSHSAFAFDQRLPPGWGLAPMPAPCTPSGLPGFAPQELLEVGLANPDGARFPLPSEGEPGVVNKSTEENSLNEAMLTLPGGVESISIVRAAPSEDGPFHDETCGLTPSVSITSSHHWPSESTSSLRTGSVDAGQPIPRAPVAIIARNFKDEITRIRGRARDETISPSGWLIHEDDVRSHSFGSQVTYHSYLSAASQESSLRGKSLSRVRGWMGSCLQPMMKAASRSLGRELCLHIPLSAVSPAWVIPAGVLVPSVLDPIARPLGLNAPQPTVPPIDAWHFKLVVWRGRVASTASASRWDDLNAKPRNLIACFVGVCPDIDNPPSQRRHAQFSPAIVEGESMEPE